MCTLSKPSMERASERVYPFGMPRQSPPHARLAFRVGVVGHRPNRLKDADLAQLGEMIYEVLDAVRAEVVRFADSPSGRSLYSVEEPILRAVTPLAEGTDRIFADQALKLRYELCCPMPFHQEEYEQDFAASQALEENSLDRFRRLLARAKADRGLTIFQLDGDKAHRGEAYGAAGRIVLNQSDLLVVVWDGGKPAGGGGTFETLREATRFGVPVIWISAIKPHSWQVLRSEKDLECLERVSPSVPSPSPISTSDAVRRIVMKEISLPSVPEPTAHWGGSGAPSAEEYFEECRPRLHLAVLWKFFRDLVGSAKFSGPSFVAQDYEAVLAHSWPTETGTPTSKWVNEKLLPHYAWSDKLADRYADAYRSTYVFIYLAAAFAVFLALLPMAAGWQAGKNIGQAFCVVGEFAILLSIIGLLTWEKIRCWHRRWLAYRLLAELIRQLKCLLPLGGGPPLPRIPEHLALLGDPGQTWMYWQLRAIARATGIPDALVTPAYLGDCLEYLDRLVRGGDGQIRFHVQNQKRSELLNHRLHGAALWMFGLTLACIAIHLLPHLFSRLGFVIDRQEQLDRWLTLICATFPAFGAAMGGINNQGEFARIEKRSRSMTDLLGRFADRIDSLQAQKASGVDGLRLKQVADLAGGVTQLMVDEVVEWRVIFIDRPATAA
jgi:hypothetical protein